MTNKIAILVTTSSYDEAKKLANALLEDKLIACANIIEDVRSMFTWHGSICNEDENLMILKSIAPHYSKIEKKIKKLHSYEVPEVVQLPIQQGLARYLKWIDDGTA